VHVGGFVDLAGNAQVEASELVFHTSDDGVPVVVSTDPAEGATGVDVGLAAISVVFSEPMNPVLGEVTLSGGPGVIGMRAWASERELRVEVAGLVAGTAYRLVLAGFEDRSGNVLDGTPVLGDSALDFITAADTSTCSRSPRSR
jgi:hypothetical protein